MPINLDKIDYSKLGLFRFKKLGKNYLLTNEVGDYVFLTQESFNKYFQGKLDKKSNQYRELFQKNFIRDKIKINQYIEKYRQKHNYLFQGPNLHIVVVTLRCNHNCIYCQTSSKRPNDYHFDMNLETAKKTVDFIFESPSPFLAIEFQGGEPLFNWEVVKFIVQYAMEKNRQIKKNLELRLVSNFSLMDEEKMEFLFENNVSLCTSLDGPEELHNRNRPFSSGNSYQETVRWLKQAMKIYRQEDRRKKKDYFYQPGALTTISRYSLRYPREIVDEYLKWGFEVIFLRPLSPLGAAQKLWAEVGYHPQEYLEFYQRALDYILELNQKGKKIYERTATIILAKILTAQDPNYLELRSPCGAGIGQLAYNYNGDIYTCDEGRMLKEIGNDLFKLGNVSRDDYSSIIDNPTLKAVCLASEITSQPQCSQCVYMPYCGLCPIYNYVVQGNIFGQPITNQRCQIQRGILDFLFKKLAKSKIKKIFKKWARNELNKGKLQKSLI